MIKAVRSLTARDWVEFALLMTLVVAVPIYGETKGIPIWIGFPAMFGLAHLLPFKKITS